MLTRQEILAALAHGYCDERNRKKRVDPELVDAMAEEVMKTIEKAIIRNEERLDEAMKAVDVMLDKQS